eukprot:3934762-Rhodomonas_salina.1
MLSEGHASNASVLSELQTYKAKVEVGMSLIEEVQRGVEEKVNSLKAELEAVPRGGGDGGNEQHLLESRIGTLETRITEMQSGIGKLDGLHALYNTLSTQVDDIVKAKVEGVSNTEIVERFDSRVRAVEERMVALKDEVDAMQGVEDGIDSSSPIFNDMGTFSTHMKICVTDARRFSLLFATLIQSLETVKQLYFLKSERTDTETTELQHALHGITNRTEYQTSHPYATEQVPSFWFSFASVVNASTAFANDD